jgi:ribose 5-phosphate isomerase B
MTLSEGEVRDIVRRVLHRTLGPDGVDQHSRGETPAGDKPPDRRMVTEDDVLAAESEGRLSIPANALVTPLARDTALERRVELVRGPEAASPAKASDAPRTDELARAKTDRTVAVGADHGGYALKELLKSHVTELGYEVTDCGTHDTSSVDYPDYAYAVACLVSEGRARWGIVVDGAGIGSCMAANKVPGVRAAMCYDHATALNSREHNDANVLTLGGALIGSSLARQIVEVWLGTNFGGGRHARRVDKIMGIEGRFLRK